MTTYRRLEQPVPALVARAGLAPLPPAWPYIGTHLVLGDDVPVKVGGLGLGLEPRVGRARRPVPRRDPSGLNCLHWVAAGHPIEAAAVYDLSTGDQRR